MKQKTRLHHQHKDWERNHRDDSAKVQIINRKKAIKRIISKERLEPYLKHHSDNFEKAIASRFQIDQVSAARNSILREKKVITTGKVIPELSFGFWTSLLDSKFERTLWKNIRLVSQTVQRTYGREKQ